MSSQKGYTLIELLIVVSIVSVLLVSLFLLGIQRQIERGHDAKRKSDLTRLKTVFEEYYNDNECYPPAGTLDTCGGTALAPYLARIPCDPAGNTPYYYRPLDGNACSGYRIFTTLSDESDPAISQAGCEGAQKCGTGASHNYGVSSGTTVAIGGGAGPTATPTTASQPSATPPPTSTPQPSATPTTGVTPTPTTRPVACAPGGQGCNYYNDPVTSGCPVWWSGACPYNACATPANWCRD